jgi:hypothetical protein
MIRTVALALASTLLVATLSSAAEPAWTHEMVKPDRHPVAALAPDVVVLREDETLVAYATKDGAKRWDLEPLERSTITVCGDLVLERGRKQARLIDPATGKVAWQPKGRMIDEPLVASDLILGIVDDRLVVFDREKGKVRWTYPKTSKKKKKKRSRKKRKRRGPQIERVSEVLRAGERVVVAGGQWLVGLDLKGKRRWSFDAGERVAGKGRGRGISVTFTQARTPADLRCDGKLLVAHSHLRIYFLDVVTGKKKGQTDIRKLKDEYDSTQPSEFTLFRGKRSPLFIVRRSKSGDGDANRFRVLDSRGKVSGKIARTELEAVSAGPDFTCILSNRQQLTCYSSAWRKLWKATGRLIPSEGGPLDAILTQTEAGIVLHDMKRGKEVAKQALKGYWTTFRVPGRLFLFDHEQLREFVSTTLEERGKLELKGVRRLHAGPGGVLVETKKRIAWLPTQTVGE